MGPLLTAKVHGALVGARRAGCATLECSLDLDRSTGTVEIEAEAWGWQGRRYPYLESCRERTVYYWSGAGFEPAARFSASLVKLVPTEWGPPTFEIDGIKMLPTSEVSPYEDARRKVELVRRAGPRVLDTCGGLGYFAAWCLHERGARVLSFERNPDVVWLRGLNPWSPAPCAALTLVEGDVVDGITTLADASVDAVLHDPPRFAIAGDLYAQSFYEHLSRVLRRGGRLFHYTGSPNRLSRGRDLPVEVSKRLRRAGFATERAGDGVLAVRR